VAVKVKEKFPWMTGHEIQQTILTTATDLGIKGEDSTLANILNFLILMSEYTGFGIKTSLGMGGIKIE